MPSQFENPMMISLFENNKVCHDYFSHSERLRTLITGEWRVANDEWDAERTIRHSPFAIGKAAAGTKPAGAGDALDRDASRFAPCRASKCLKMFKTTRANYWLELASIWDRRYVPLGSAAPRLRHRYARNDGKRPWKWEQSEPSPSPSRVISFWASPYRRGPLSRPFGPPSPARGEEDRLLRERARRDLPADISAEFYANVAARRSVARFPVDLAHFDWSSWGRRLPRGQFGGGCRRGGDESRQSDQRCIRKRHF